MSSNITFRRSISLSTNSWLYCLKRFFWASMLILHASPIHAVTLRALESSNSPAMSSSVWSLFGLGLSAIFFVLKVADVTWLRRNPGWQSAVASTMVVALIHVGVLSHSNQVNNYSQITPLGVMVLAAIVTDAPRAVQRRVRAFSRWLSHRCGERFNLTMFRAWRGWIHFHCKQFQRWFHACLPARAPPLYLPI